MPVVAYLANQFPSSVEHYVMDEIKELRRHGVNVIPCSVWPSDNASREELRAFESTAYLWPLRIGLSASATWLCLGEFQTLTNLLRSAWRDRPSIAGYARAFLHTWLGAYLAQRLRGQGAQHIHIHHGYFASWVGMAAAYLLGIPFSLTLHGSDLLVHKTYLAIKLQRCKFCLTVSEFNRQYILDHYPEVDPDKIIVQHLGVDFPATNTGKPIHNLPPIVLAVGRLHSVKDHAFLVSACCRLKDRGESFLCLIAGEGPERVRLEHLIRKLQVQNEVNLLGHVPRRQLENLYAAASVVVLTSHSEGLPLVLMEAMAHGRLVLAPAITGIPELILDGKTGFLYEPGSLESFTLSLQKILRSQPRLGKLQNAARQHVLQHFHRGKNLARFVDLFIARALGASLNPETHIHEDLVLQ